MPAVTVLRRSRGARTALILTFLAAVLCGLYAASGPQGAAPFALDAVLFLGTLALLGRQGAAGRRTSLATAAAKGGGAR